MGKVDADWNALWALYHTPGREEEALLSVLDALKWMIQAYVTKAAESKRLSANDELDDFRSELTVVILENFPKYDPTKAKFSTVIHDLFDYSLNDYIRGGTGLLGKDSSAVVTAYQAKKEKKAGFTRRIDSLDALIEASEDGGESLFGYSRSAEDTYFDNYIAQETREFIEGLNQLPLTPKERKAKLRLWFALQELQEC